MSTFYPRDPAPAVVKGARAEAPTTCPACASAAIGTTAKTPDASSYWRCEHCGEVWNVGRRDAVRRGAGSWR